jgi:hypothetical protein
MLMAKYINNKEFRDIMIEYHNDPDSRAGSKLYEKIGAIVLLLANKIISSGSFRNYPQELKEEMVSDAAYTMIKNLHKYDHEKYDNPFSYFTTVVRNIFFQHMNKNKTNLDRHVRLESLSGNGLEFLIVDNKFHDKMHHGKVTTTTQK